MKQYIKILLLVCSVMLLCNSCKKSNPVNNSDDTNYPPGRRDYVWTVDTLHVNGQWITALYGASPNELWAVGPFSEANKSLWHYTNGRWTLRTDISITGGGQIFGLNASNIWIGTSEGAIWKYNGANWKIDTILIPKGSYGMAINGIYGTSPDNIYATGHVADSSGSVYTGCIAHYNGKIWKILNLPPNRLTYTNMLLNHETGKYIVATFNWDNTGPAYCLYEFDGSNLILLHSGQANVSMSEINGKIYVNINSSAPYYRLVYKLQNNKLVLWRDFSLTRFWVDLTGRNENDCFTGFLNVDRGGGVIDTGGIAHYNGTDFKLLFKINASIHPRIFFEKDVFFMAADFYGPDYYFIHGKLP